MDKIEEILLKEGGQRVLRIDQCYDDLIIRKGKLVKHSKKIEVIDGLEHNCHRTCSCMFVLHYPIYNIVTGYALSDDLWLRHSWLMYKHTEKRKVIDPTTEFDKYFGVALNEEETAKFVLPDFLEALPYVSKTGQRPV